LLLTPAQPLIPSGIIVIVGGGTLAMMLLPFFDRSAERRPTRRPEVLVPALFMIFAVVFLAMLGVNRLYSL
ncbi:MAG: hypothetical protein JOZ92_08840, partial [Candidatus Dormibacteraeota bacterium]|nr:hypothetical protein [Candidatus Dormibacteraeota bacterium]